MFSVRRGGRGREVEGVVDVLGSASVVGDGKHNVRDRRSSSAGQVRAFTKHTCARGGRSSRKRMGDLVQSAVNAHGARCDHFLLRLLFVATTCSWRVRWQPNVLSRKACGTSGEGARARAYPSSDEKLPDARGHLATLKEIKNHSMPVGVRQRRSPAFSTSEMSPTQTVSHT